MVIFTLPDMMHGCYRCLYIFVGKSEKVRECVCERECERGREDASRRDYVVRGLAHGCLPMVGGEMAPGCLGRPTRVTSCDDG